MRCVPCNLFNLCFFRCAERNAKFSRFAFPYLLEVMIYVPVFLTSGFLLLLVDLVFAVPAYFLILARAIDSRQTKYFFLTLFLFPLSIPAIAIIDFIRFYLKMWQFSPHLKN